MNPAHKFNMILDEGKAACKACDAEPSWHKFEEYVHSCLKEPSESHHTHQRKALIGRGGYVSILGARCQPQLAQIYKVVKDVTKHIKATEGNSGRNTEVIKLLVCCRSKRQVPHYDRLQHCVHSLQDDPDRLAALETACHNYVKAYMEHRQKRNQYQNKSRSTAPQATASQSSETQGCNQAPQRRPQDQDSHRNHSEYILPPIQTTKGIPQSLPPIVSVLGNSLPCRGPQRPLSANHAGVNHAPVGSPMALSLIS